MLKIWKDTWEKQNVVTSGATDREPVDSTVRVTPPTQQRDEAVGLTMGKRRKDRTGTEDTVDDTQDDRMSKRPKLGSKVDDLVVQYDSPRPQGETDLYTRLYAMDKELSLSRHFKNARRILAELGPCAADLLWRQALEDRSIAKANANEETISPAIREFIENWTFDMPNPSPLSTNYNVSPQFSKLVEVLQSCETQDASFRGIIIVKRPVVAAMIVDLLIALDDALPALRPHAIIGPSAFQDKKEQKVLLNAFVTGTYNLIVTTKYAEYLDLPRLSVVIQYSLFEKPPLNVLSRAHSDMQDTLVIHMAERNNDLHKRLLQSYRDSRADNPQTAGPQPPVSGDSVSDSEDEQDTTEYIQDPTTGRKIRQSDSTVVIHRVAESSSTPGAARKPTFKLRQDDQGRYVCSIDFPVGRHTRTVEGSPQPSVSAAKDSTSYHLCHQLFDKGLLDYRVFPSNASSSGEIMPDAGKDVQSSNSSSTTRCYPRKAPQFWSNTFPLLKDKDRLYPLIISVDRFKNEHHAPMLLLTRFWLPTLAEFSVFSAPSKATVHMRRAAPIRVGRTKMHALYHYTLRVSRTVINKPVECLAETMPYFFAPVSAGWDVTRADLNQEGFPIVEVPWDDVERAVDNWATPLLPDGGTLTDAALQDTIVQDRMAEFTNRHYFVRVRRDMTPLSKAAEGEREAGHANFLEYCKSRRKEFTGLKNENQPLIEVSPVPQCVNNLSPTSRAIISSAQFPAKYLIPELCFKFSIPASTFRTALLLPSILHEIDSQLLVKELNAILFDNAIAETHLKAAVVSPNAAMGQDYERLELLGDAFLKYVTSTYVYATMPNAREGSLHGARQRIISNKALRVGAIEVGIPPYIQSKPVVPKVWQPYMLDSEDTPKIEATGDVKEESPVATVPPKSINAPNAGATRGVKEESPVAAIPRRSAAPTVDAIKSVKEESPVATVPKSGGGSANASKAADATKGVKEESPVATIPRKPAEENPSEASPGPSKQGKRPRIPGGKRKRQQDELAVQWLGDKTVADVIEAIIGAAHLTAGRDLALRIAKVLHVPFPAVEQWSDFARAPVPNTTVDYQLPTAVVKRVQEITGFKFERPAILAEALAHSSVANHAKNYDRLEFLGDAVLEIIVVTHLFHGHPNLSPGGLSLLKAAMVSNNALATICVLTGLYETLQYASSDLATSITVYAAKIRALRDEEHKLAEKDHRLPRQFWLEVEPPKALSDIVEALMGAMYVSDNYDMGGVEAFFNKHLKPFFDRHIRLQTLCDHPNTTLTDLFHAEGCSQHSVVKEATGPTVRYDVVVHGTVLASASDPLGNAALRKAAMAALDALANDPGFITRVCDCRMIRQSKKVQKKDKDKREQPKSKSKQADQVTDGALQVKREESDDEMPGVEGEGTPDVRMKTEEDD